MQRSEEVDNLPSFSSSAGARSVQNVHAALVILLVVAARVRGAPLQNRAEELEHAVDRTAAPLALEILVELRVREFIQAEE
jgi:hypothetical protein